MLSDDSYAGWHYAFDASVDEDTANKMRNQTFVRATLESVVMHIGKIPLLMHNNGLMFVCMFDSYHATIVSKPDECRISLDIFSSKKLDEASIEEHLRDRLTIIRRNSHLVHRIWP